jgi:hypothetical protein
VAAGVVADGVTFVPIFLVVKGDGGLGGEGKFSKGASHRVESSLPNGERNVLGAEGFIFGGFNAFAGAENVEEPVPGAVDGCLGFIGGARVDDGLGVKQDADGDRLDPVGRGSSLVIPLVMEERRTSMSPREFFRGSGAPSWVNAFAIPRSSSDTVLDLTGTWLRLERPSRMRVARLRKKGTLSAKFRR